MELLEEKLMSLVETLEQQQYDDVKRRLDDLVSMYPFNKYEFLISSLIGYGKISIDDYYKLRNDYFARNKSLFIFEISSPTGFGRTWAEGHLKDICPELVKPTKKLDPNYSNEYDLFLDSKIKIEVKASRAVDADSDKPLYAKALTSDSTKRFDMNFQQLKPACCDVFIWVGVWSNVIRYWIFSSNEILENKGYSPQHRGSIGEGQIHLKESNIAEFVDFESSAKELIDDVRKAYLRQKSKDKND